MAYEWDRSKKEVYKDNIESSKCKQLKSDMITLGGRPTC